MKEPKEQMDGRGNAVSNDFGDGEASANDATINACHPERHVINFYFSNSRGRITSS